MLILKPNCENCDCNLPADSKLAYICSYECTFCYKCVNQHLKNVCPNCGGNFQLRPIRPKIAHRTGVNLDQHPASQKRIHTSYSQQEIIDFSHAIKGIAPDKR